LSLKLFGLNQLERYSDVCFNFKGSAGVEREETCLEIKTTIEYKEEGKLLLNLIINLILNNLNY